MARAREAKRVKADLLDEVRRELNCDLRAPVPDSAQSTRPFEVEPACTSRFHRMPIHELPRWASSSDLVALQDLNLIELLRLTGLTRKDADASLVHLHNLCAPEPGAGKRDLTLHRSASTPAKRARWDIGWLTAGTARGRRQCAWKEITAPMTPLPPNFPFVESMMVRRDDPPVLDAQAVDASQATSERSEAPKLPDVSEQETAIGIASEHRLEEHQKQQHDASFNAAHATFETAEAVPMTDELDFLPNRSHIPVQDRVDPYWIYLRDDVITLRNVAEERHAARQYLRRMALPRDYHHATPRPPQEAPPKPDFLTHELLKKRELFMRVTGVVHSLRTVNEQQICCLVGPRFTTRQVRRQLTLGFEAGLFRRSDPFQLESGPTIYSPASGGAFQTLSEGHLSRAQVAAILGGGQWSGTGTSGRRHDLIASELHLRLTEVGAGRMVLAETFASRRHHLAGEHSNPGEASWRHGRADGVVIRSDGLPIAIELTSQTNKTFERKVTTWVDYLLDVPNEQGGADVIFVIATPPTDNTRGALKRAALAIVTAIDARGAHSVAGRIGVVAWTDWFPLDHMRVDAVAELRALTLLTDGLTWEPRPFSNPKVAPLSTARRAKALVVIDHAAYLGQTTVHLSQPLLESHRARKLVLGYPWQIENSAGGAIGVAPLRNAGRAPSLEHSQRVERLRVPARLRGLEI